MIRDFPRPYLGLDTGTFPIQKYTKFSQNCELISQLIIAIIQIQTEKFYLLQLMSAGQINYDKTVIHFISNFKFRLV